MSESKVSHIQLNGTVIYLALCQQWEESEQGWGVRPNGYSLHTCQTDLEAYVAEYWDRMPKTHVPHEYSRVSGSPYWCEVDEAIADKINASKNGIRDFGRPPEEPTIDGWINLK